jgi:hypothetical protein
MGNSSCSYYSLQALDFILQSCPKNMNAKPFKSPKHKLISFFQRSRDKWKERARRYFSQIRALDVRVRDLEASRDHWRKRYFTERAGAPAPAGRRCHFPPPAGFPPGD